MEKELNDKVMEKEQGKPKQKAGLNAVRPGDYVEGKFKELAKGENISQTDLFERMFWTYISDIRNDKRENAVRFDDEINLISKDLGSIMKHFKAIVERSQDTVLNVQANGEQKEKNLTLEIETLNNKVKELSVRNNELENSNNIFSEVKKDLEGKISKLSEDNFSMQTGIMSLKGDMKEKDKEIKESLKSNEGLEKENARYKRDVGELTDKINSKDSKISGLESTNSSLQDTISTIDKLKKVEISASESKYKEEISLLKLRLESIGSTHEKEIETVKLSMKNEFEAEKKYALASSILELAKAESRYAEIYNKYNELSNKYNEISKKKASRQQKVTGNEK